MDYEDITLIKDRAEKNLHALSKTIPDGPKRKRNFCGLWLPADDEPLGRVSAHQGIRQLVDCSKKVRTSFSNCDFQ